MKTHSASIIDSSFLENMQHVSLSCDSEVFLIDIPSICNPSLSEDAMPMKIDLSSESITQIKYIPDYSLFVCINHKNSIVVFEHQ